MRPAALRHGAAAPAGTPHLVYHCLKPQSGGQRADPVLTPLELIDRIAALVPRHAHIGEDSRPPRVTPARGPTLWDEHDAVVEAGADPEWDPSAQIAPEYQVDQRINW